MANAKKIKKFVSKIRRERGIWKLVGALAPFRAAMINQLAIKGVAVDSTADLFLVILTFAKFVVGGTPGKKADEILEIIETGEGYDGGIYVDNIAAATIAAIATIVSAVVSFIKHLKARADRGELPANQAAAIDVADDVLDATRAGLGVGLPGGGDPMTILLLLGAAYFLLKGGN